MQTVFLGLRAGRQGQPVTVPLLTRTRGQYVVGVTGVGKSTYLLGQIVQDLAAGRGVFVLDPNGDLIDDVLARVSGYKRQRDVVLLDLQSTTVAFGLNVFACPNPNDPIQVAETVERVVGIFKKIWGDMSWGVRMESLLEAVVYTLVANPGATLLDVRPLLTNPSYRKKLVARVLDPEIRGYWQDEFDILSPAARQQIYGPLTNKIRMFTSHPLLREVVGAKQSSIDWRVAIDERKIVLIRLDSHMEEATRLIGTVIIQQLLEAAFSRQNLPKPERFPFMLYFDEAHNFVNDGFVKLLKEARKYGCCTTAATQLHSQMPENVAAAFLNGGMTVCFQTIDKDAKALAPMFSGQAFRKPPTFEADPLGQILRSGHSDVRMVQAARAIEQTLTAYQAAFERYGRDLRFEGYDAPLTSSHLRGLQSLIDTYLFEAMRLGNYQRPWDALCRFAPRQVPSKVVEPLLAAIEALAGLLSDTPIIRKEVSDATRVAKLLPHLPPYHALVRFSDGKTIREAFIRTLQTKPLGPALTFAPVGLPRSAPTLPVLQDETVFFDAGPEGAFDQPPPASHRLLT